MTRKRTVSGMRPTGPLHLGHYFGVIKNWLKLQEETDCYLYVADWHALTSDYADTSNIKQYVSEMVKDWLASGLDPEKCTIFQQSAIKEHAELHLLLSMVTPLGWLERCPTYKEQRDQITHKDLGNYGFLGYPVLMATDILMYRPDYVPVGQDQLPHIELSREIARRFNHLYDCSIFPEPEGKLTPEAKLPGLDGRKMSKSYNNGIFLRESMEEIVPKVRGMLTDKNRLRRKDPGDPDICNLFQYHLIMTSEEKQAEVRQGCTTAGIGCIDCKKILLESMEEYLAPIQERRRELDANPKLVQEVLAHGNERATKMARETMELVRSAINFDF